MTMSNGESIDMHGDARVKLASSDSSCVEVRNDLSASDEWHYRAVPGAACTQAIIQVRFTFGSWEETVDVQVFIARAVPASFSLSSTQFPSCQQQSENTLYTLGCSQPPVRQKVRFSAAYALKTDLDLNTWSQTGIVDLGHSDVTHTSVNFEHVSVATRTEVQPGDAVHTVEMLGESDVVHYTISDDMLNIKSLNNVAIVPSSDTVISNVHFDIQLEMDELSGDLGNVHL